MASGALVVALLLTGPTVTFEWAEPEGGIAPDHYEVEFSQEDLAPVLMTTDEPSISLSPGLGRNFEIRVRGCARITCGLWSELSQTMSLNRSSDFNDDGVVGLPDYQRFGNLVRSQEPEADLDGDLAIGIPDYAEFAEHFGTCVGNVSIGGHETPAYVPCRVERSGF